MHEFSKSQARAVSLAREMANQAIAMARQAFSSAVGDVLDELGLPREGSYRIEADDEGNPVGIVEVEEVAEELQEVAAGA